MTWSRHGRWRPFTGALVAAGLGLGAAACGSATPSATGPEPPSSTTSASSSPSTTPSTAPPATAQTAPSSIAIGPGTRSTYTVLAQPPPGTCHYRTEDGDPLPDPSCTPGAINPMVTQADIATTICRAGWTADVRPPTSVTDPEKEASALAYGYTGSFATAEYDHLIPLELGGDPDDPANLWVEPNDIAGATSTRNGKDGLENTLRELVCSGSLPLATARQAIASDWVAAARKYGG